MIPLHLKFALDFACVKLVLSCHATTKSVKLSKI